MKTEKELNQNILEITMKIQNEYPELSKYIAEMPAQSTGIDNKEININNLKEYYDSLEELLKKYSEEHKNTAK